MWTQIVTLIGHYPGEAIALLLLVLMASFIITGIFLACWAEREARQQETERQRFQRIVQANEPPYRAMASRQHNRPQASGLHHRKIS